MKTAHKFLQNTTLDDECLLRFVLKKTQEELLLNPIKKIPARVLIQLERLKKLRATGMPMQYIVGNAWFFGLKFFVSPAVLIPRPETELLVERTLEILKSTPQITAIDIGTGSGAIACALAKNSSAKIIATDISSHALTIAKKNARRHHAKIKFFKSNLLTTIPWPRTQNVLITANLPYLSDKRMKKLSKEVQREPKLALYGGSDGLQLYKKLFAQISTKKTLKQKITVLAEIDPEQRKNLTSLIAREIPSALISFFTDLHGDIRLAEIKITF